VDSAATNTSNPPSEPVTPPVEVPPVAPAEPVTPPVEVPPVTPKEPEVIEYDLEIEENSPLTDDEIQKIADYASKYNLPKEEAQALVKQQESAFSRGKSEIEAAYNQKIELNKKMLNEHPEFSGEKKVESYAAIKKAVEVFGNEELLKTLGSPEYGYDVNLALMLKEIGKMLMPEVLPGQGTSTAHANGNSDAQKEYEERMKARYPRFFKG